MSAEPTRTDSADAAAASTVLSPSVEELQAVRKGFLTSYLVLGAIGAVLAAAFQPRSLILVAAFGLLLVPWWRQVRKVPDEPPVLVVSAQSLRWASGTERAAVRRDDLAVLQIRRRSLGRAGSIDELSARDAMGNVVLRISLWDRNATVRALRNHAWPVDLRV